MGKLKKNNHLRPIYLNGPFIILDLELYVNPEWVYEEVTSVCMMY